MKSIFLYFLILLNFLFHTTLLSFSCENSFKTALSLKNWFEEESFFVSLKGYQEKPLEIKNFDLLGKVKIKERLYKNEKSKVKVRIIWGEDLIRGWERLLFNFLKIPKESLKEVKVKGISGYLYEKPGNKHSLVFPIFKNSSKAFLICFDFNYLSLNESLSILEKFPLEKFLLGSCSQN